MPTSDRPWGLSISASALAYLYGDLLVTAPPVSWLPFDRHHLPWRNAVVRRQALAEEIVLVAVAGLLNSGVVGGSIGLRNEADHFLWGFFARDTEGCILAARFDEPPTELGRLETVLLETLHGADGGRMSLYEGIKRSIRFGVDFADFVFAHARADLVRAACFEVTAATGLTRLRQPEIFSPSAPRIATLEEEAKRLVQALQHQERERSRLWSLIRRDIAEAARVHQDRRSPG